MTFNLAGLAGPPHSLLTRNTTKQLDITNTPQVSLPPLLFALKNEIKDEDDDDGQHDHYSRAKPKNIFHLQHISVYFPEKY